MEPRRIVWNLALTVMAIAVVMVSVVLPAIRMRAPIADVPLPPPGSVIVVIDVSGSMGSGRRQVASAACADFALQSALARGATVACYAYAAGVARVVPLGSAQSQQREDATAALDDALRKATHVPEHGTRPALVLQAVIHDHALVAPAPRRLLVITDGDNDLAADAVTFSRAAGVIATAPDTAIAVVGVTANNAARWRQAFAAAGARYSAAPIDGAQAATENLLASH